MSGDMSTVLPVILRIITRGVVHATLDDCHPMLLFNLLYVFEMPDSFAARYSTDLSVIIERELVGYARDAYHSGTLAAFTDKLYEAFQMKWR